MQARMPARSVKTPAETGNGKFVKITFNFCVLAVFVGVFMEDQRILVRIIVNLAFTDVNHSADYALTENEYSETRRLSSPRRRPGSMVPRPGTAQRWVPAGVYPRAARSADPGAGTMRQQVTD
jgi:hypothetical protein